MIIMLSYKSCAGPVALYTPNEVERIYVFFFSKSLSQCRKLSKIKVNSITDRRETIKSSIELMDFGESQSKICKRALEVEC